MTIYKGTIAKKATFNKGNITSAIQLAGEVLPIQLVIFKKDIPASVEAFFQTADIGDPINLDGRLKKNPYNGQTEIVVNRLVDENEGECPTEFGPSTPPPPLMERRMEVRKCTFPNGKYFYSDGIEFWTERNGEKKPLSYDLLKHYNNSVTMDKWFLPDWYSVKSAESMI